MTPWFRRMRRGRSPTGCRMPRRNAAIRRRACLQRHRTGRISRTRLALADRRGADRGVTLMEVGIFVPIGNNGWLISENSPQYMPSFDLNKEIAHKAEKYGVDFLLSMIKLRGFGGKTEFWEYNLESFTLMAGLAAVTEKIRIYATCPTLVIPPAFCARMCNTIDSISHGRFGLNLITGWQRPEYQPDGAVAGRRAFPQPLPDARRICPHPARAVGDRRLRLQGRILPDGRLPRPAAARGRHEDHLRRLVGRGPRLLGPICRLRLLPRQGRQHADRLRLRTTNG